ncbi:MAG: TolC family protein [Chloroherpetonaceae bacterium]|nr:TolC family protein [Chloroherpetonaceae bacterium]
MNAHWEKPVPKLAIGSLLFLSSFALPLGAQTQRYYVAQGDSLAIEQFLDIVLQANPTSISAELENDIASASLRNALGGFDPTFNLEYEYKTKEGVATADVLHAGLELPFSTLFGPKFVAKYKRGEGSRISNVDRTSPDGEASFGLKIPLLQGIFTDKRRASLAKANFRLDLAKANQREQQNELLRNASLAYWTWAEAYAQMEVSKAVLDLAIARYKGIAERARRGEAAPIDSVEALLEVEKRRGDFLKAERKTESATIKLSVFLWNSDGTPRPVNAVPTKLPDLPTISPFQIQNDKRLALLQRPEIGQIEFEQRSASVDLAFASEFQRPFIELSAEAMQYKFSKLGANDYRLGLTISQPLFFREANSNVQLAEIKVRRVELKRMEIERKILASIDDAVSAIERAKERVEVAEREARYAYLVQEGERRKFQLGESTILILNLRERATAEAQIKLVEARADYLRAVSDYLWATGRIQEKWVK